jgi:glutaminase
MLVTHLENPKQDFLDFIRMISGVQLIINLKVAQSEKILVSEMPLWLILKSLEIYIMMLMKFWIFLFSSVFYRNDMQELAHSFFFSCQ